MKTYNAKVSIVQSREGERKTITYEDQIKAESSYIAFDKVMELAKEVVEEGWKVLGLSIVVLGES